MSVMEILVRARDEASATLERVGETGGEAAGLIERNWRNTTLAMGAAGVAVDALARSQAPLTEQTRRLAQQIGVSEAEMRELALAVTSVDTPLTDVLPLFETARQQGLRTGEELQRFANFWDMVGDATGEAGPALAESGVALRAVGVAAGEEAQALGAFGYIAQETTGSVNELLTFLGRMGPQLREMNLGVDDAAAIMGILEHELGLTARTARTEFRAAVNEADGDLDVMLATLGVSTSTLEEYRAKVAESSGVIERNAEIHARSYTPLQQFGQTLQELQYRYGGVIEGAAGLAPLLLAAPALARGASAAMDGLAAAKLAAVTQGRLLNTVLTTLARHPLVLVATGAAVAFAAVQTFGGGNEGASHQVQQLSEAIRAQNSLIGENTREWLRSTLMETGRFGQDLIRGMSEVGLTIEDLEAALVGGDEAIAGFAQRLRDGGTDIADFREAGDGLTGMLRDHGIWAVPGIGDFVQRVTGAEDATVTLTDKLGRLGADWQTANELAQASATVFPEAGGAAEDLAGEVDELAGSQQDAADATRAHLEALRAQQDEARKALDPLFAFNRAQEDLYRAQGALNDAIAQHGPASGPARRAALDLAAANLDVAYAAGRATDGIGTMRSKSIPHLQAMRDAGLINEQQFWLQVAAIEAAGASAAGLDGRVVTMHAALDRSRLDATLRDLANTMVTIPIVGRFFARIGSSHSGSTFRAPMAGGEGLALLRDGQQVLPPGARASGGPGTAAVLDALARIERALVAGQVITVDGETLGRVTRHQARIDSDRNRRVHL